MWVSHVGGGGRIGEGEIQICQYYYLDRTLLNNKNSLQFPYLHFKKNSLNVPLAIFIQIKYYYVGIIFFWMGFDWVRGKNFAEIKTKEVSYI